MRKSHFRHQHINLSAIGTTGVEEITVSAAVAFTVDSSKVFRDDNEISPITLPGGIQYMPWGADNQLPYHILDMIEKDETCPWHDLEERLKHGKARKFALVSRVPTPDSTYYPIPYYAALLVQHWYNTLSNYVRFLTFRGIPQHAD